MTWSLQESHVFCLMCRWSTGFDIRTLARPSYIVIEGKPYQLESYDSACDRLVHLKIWCNGQKGTKTFILISKHLQTVTLYVPKFLYVGVSHCTYGAGDTAEDEKIADRRNLKYSWEAWYIFKHHDRHCSWFLQTSAPRWHLSLYFWFRHLFPTRVPEGATDYAIELFIRLE